MSGIAKLQEQLDRRASRQTKVWWERYLKGAVPFRGVRMADIRAAVHAWHKDQRLAEVPAAGQVDLATSLIRETYCEDKIAGILLVAEVLIPKGLVSWHRDLPRLGELFEDGSIADWNTCDWLCVKVLGPLARREGE